jgi:hypothetical protein
VGLIGKTEKGTGEIMTEVMITIVDTTEGMTMIGGMTVDMIGVTIIAGMTAIAIMTIEATDSR